MTGTVSEIWRHPIKALGRERLSRVALETGNWLPGDRVWAIAHERAKLTDGWMHKVNFLRGVTDPNLMAVTARLDDAENTVTLDHPVAGQITVNPDTDAGWPVFAEWLGRVWSSDLPPPTGVVRRSGVHMTDVPDPWISLHNLSSHRAVEGRVGRKMSIHRWRGNLWLDGLGPWEEFEWIGRTLQIGEAVLKVETRITRCKATMANPETGRRDIDTLGALESWDHQDFGVYASVLEGGHVANGDAAKLI